MPRLGPDNGTLEILLERFRSLLKPPDAIFTKQLPDDLESNAHLISMAMYIMNRIGYTYNENIPRELNLLAHRATAIDFISVMKVERPDIIHFLLQSLPSSPPSSIQTHPTQSTTRTQFHHYIPQFILKTFTDNFSLKNTEFITDTSSPGLSGFKPNNIKRKERPGYDINVYRVEDHATVLISISRAYGAEDMYRDVTETDCMKFEKLLAKHESFSAKFIRQIWNEEENLSLTRAQLGDMKFLAIMIYRSEYRRSQYFDQRFDPITETSIKKHMDHNKFSNVQMVWFENLKWIIEASTEDIAGEFHKALVARAKSERPAMLLSPYQGPIHVSELEEFGCLMTQTIVCIWQAEAGSEFILSEGCFGAWERDIGIRFQHFFIISPQFAIVLVNKLYLTERDKKKPHWTSLFGDKLHVFPETDYKKGPPPRSSDLATLATHFTPDDVFKYKRIVKEDVFKFNAISLDSRRQFLTYKSNVSMYKSLCYYDKVKKEKFHEWHDYSILRRKLFSDLNRTHPVDL
ncbi:hypothetical protein BGX21_010434 [Mortierella sp. AD011]|nr:hypothetical protein BGX20_001510 [Mortierella sp. AD010]KAF9394251.1 hypothetical protein BGX21_010434 [Mortierella sp. AD011]